MKIVKIQLFPRNTHLSVELELVICTIRKGIKSTILMHKLIFVISFQERIKTYFLFSVIFAQFLTFYPKLINAPTARVLKGLILKHFYRLYKCIWQLKVYIVLICIIPKILLYCHNFKHGIKHPHLNQKGCFILECHPK